MKKSLLGLVLLMGLWATIFAQPLKLALSKEQVEVYGFQEIKIDIKKPDPKLNPFKQVQLLGTFTAENGVTKTVAGFCDSQDGSLYRLRFMPDQVGKYNFEVALSQNGKTQKTTGTFEAITSSRKGVLRLDKDHPWHFKFDNGDHYFWNSTTAYWMLGLKNEAEILASIDRLAGYGINRIRVAINGRAHGGERWNEPTVVESNNFPSNSIPGWPKNQMIWMPPILMSPVLKWGTGRNWTAYWLTAGRGASSCPSFFMWMALITPAIPSKKPTWARRMNRCTMPMPPLVTRPTKTSCGI